MDQAGGGTLIEIIGDLWELHQGGAWACVPTNNETNARGDAIMGRGVALQAKERWPALPQVLGVKLRRQGPGVYWFPEWRLITFPTKHRWRERADIELIAASTLELAVLLTGLETVGWHLKTVVLPRPGCGNGGLRWEDVRPFVATLDDRVHVVCPPWEVLGGA